MTFYWFGWLVTGSKFFAIKFKDRVLLLFIFVIYRHLYAHLHACFSYAQDRMIPILLETITWAVPSSHDLSQSNIYNPNIPCVYRTVVQS